MSKVITGILLFFITLIFACNKEEPEPQDEILQLKSARVGTVDLSSSQTTENTPLDKPIVLSFVVPVDTTTVKGNLQLKDADSTDIGFDIAYLDNFKSISLIPHQELEYFKNYKLTIGELLRGAKGEVFPGISYVFKTKNGELLIEEVTINDVNFNTNNRIKDIDREVAIEVYFSDSVDASDLESKISLTRPGSTIPLSFSLSEGDTIVTITNDQTLDHYSRYTFNIASTLQSRRGFTFEGFSNRFHTRLDSTFKFPEITDDELLTLVQQQTFKYFWDFAHPVSGLARERNTSGEIVTIGGSGFGIMALIVGMERGFITREEGLQRLSTILDFLENADRFHGVWPHWMNGTTGEVIPFSSNDDGGDLVETSFMIQGLLTMRQYLDSTVTAENELKIQIDSLWRSVEFDWYTQGGQDVLYWHWSPNFGWEKNHQIRGWNEALIVYVLAAASPTHTIDPSVYHSGWARDGAMQNGKDFYGITLPLGNDLGGPLFFAHYSFLGLDPGNLEDQYANYWTQNVNHALINWNYSVDNPKGFVGYNEAAWGLTASDNHSGYSAHSPTNDLGVITPTAAVASLPYTPQRSLDAIRYFYYIVGDRLWGEYGYHDAYNVTQFWWASSYLAIDQGPIVIMIENHRSQLLWNLFMSHPDVQQGLDKLGFTY